jgi:hypothetical protein
MTAMVMGLVATYFGGAFTFVACGGNAPASRQAAWCDAIVESPLGLLVFGFALTVGVGLAAWSAQRSVARAASRWVIFALLAPPFCVAVTVPIVLAPGNHCSQEQRAANESWRALPPGEGGRKPPYDCEIPEGSS